MDARKCEKKSEVDNENHLKHKVRPSGDYYFKVKPNSKGSTAKGSNNDGVCCNTCYKPRGKEYDIPMRWMDIDGRSWMIGDAGRLSVQGARAGMLRIVREGSQVKSVMRVYDDRVTKCDEAWIMRDVHEHGCMDHKTRQGDKVKHDKATGGNTTMRLGEMQQGVKCDAVGPEEIQSMSKPIPTGCPRYDAKKRNYA
ncbi:hypothetical protein F4604DRAFT_1683765 [Suillus subluteus]|nr:hypothetical protein F4604DRAFT_1683765 [Suillus subluteus]